LPALISSSSPPASRDDLIGTNAKIIAEVGAAT
jgi:malate/lactate dehydrogenase